jgi:hypothetical protein
VSESSAQGDGHLGSERGASRRRARPRKPDTVPDAGRIAPLGGSIVQTIVAVAFLILVTLVSFGAVMLIGDLTRGNRATYWMIELIFALLCGGAGALVGGSAVVRSTLRLPGSPVHATLGGAISMVIVGFALAWLGQPPDDVPMYALEIHKLPDRQTVGNEEYRVFVGAVTSNLAFSRESSNVSIKIPPYVGTHRLLIAVYRPAGKDLSRTYARCELAFDTLDSERTRLTPMALVPGRAAQYHLFFSEGYIEKAVTTALQRNEAVTSEPCVEGQVATKPDLTPLDSRFTLQPNSAGSRALSFAQLSPLPRFSVLARDRSSINPEDTQPDLPPQARPAPGLAAPGLAAPGLAAPGLAAPSLAAPSLAPTSPASASATIPPDAPRQSAALSRGAVETAAPAAAASAAPSPRAAKLAPPPAAPPPVVAAAPAAADRGAGAKARPLTDEVDAYVRGEDRDRTELYQSWGEVADYVVKGLREESAKNSKLVAPYLNLIANALNVIDEGKYLSPTLRPNWDQSAKSDRLVKTAGIPGFDANDYKIAVDSLCSTDEDVRRAAQRLLKLYPSNHFYAHLQALAKQANFDKCKVAFLAETAAYYFYNRIVEYDGTFTLDNQSLAAIEENRRDGTEWAKRGEAQDASFGLFTAMLDYARGLVLWDHGEKKDASAAFNQMIDRVRTANRIYPSNPQHIAAALRLVYDPAHPAQSLRGAVVFNPPDRLAAARAYMVGEGAIALHAAPESSKQTGRMKPDATARLYLRLNNWDLLEGGGQVGWARRVVASAAR